MKKHRHKGKLIRCWKLSTTGIRRNWDLTSGLSSQLLFFVLWKTEYNSTKLLSFFLKKDFKHHFIVFYIYYCILVNTFLKECIFTFTGRLIGNRIQYNMHFVLKLFLEHSTHILSCEGFWRTWLVKANGDD